ncbi:MAG: S41 family peptidase [bacterium]|nr:S41 family peptidase [bacterium]
MPDEETQKNIGTRTAAISAAIIIAIGFMSGFTLGTKGFLASSIPPSITKALAEGAEEPLGVNFSPVWKAWRIIDEKFVPAAVGTSTPIATTTKEINDERVWGMIQGLAGSLNDPYTYFLPPVENEQFADDMSGSFEGVGMEIAVRDQVLTVVSPLKGTPSERAGIKSGDRILKIDETDTKDMDVTTAVKLIRGPHGSSVTLTILREGFTAPKEIKVTRDVIDIPTVTTKILPNGIFSIQLMSFSAQSPNLFRNALREFIESGDTKLILDLRGNPGGYLEAAVDMASWFLPTGKVIVTEDYAGHAENIVHRSRGYDIFNDNLKMVILVDRGSASASEILAAALRHYGKAKLVGETTFGKGSVQELIEITPDTALKLTIARWLGPDGKQIPHTGIVPDVEVKMTEADTKAEKDPQLDKAVELVNSL